MEIREAKFCPTCGQALLIKWQHFRYVYACKGCEFPEGIWEIIPIYNETDLEGAMKVIDA